MLNEVAPGFSKRCTRYAFCMSDTRVRYAYEVRQHYMYLCKILKIIRVPWKFFQRIKIFCILLIVVSFNLYCKNFTTIFSLFIWKLSPCEGNITALLSVRVHARAQLFYVERGALDLILY